MQYWAYKIWKNTKIIARARGQKGTIQLSVRLVRPFILGRGIKGDTVTVTVITRQKESRMRLPHWDCKLENISCRN